ncbi:MAG: DUF1853 family protein [Bacteroidota bacterium]
MMTEVLKGFLETAPLWKKRQFGLQQFEFPKLPTNGFAPIDLPTKIRLGHQMEYVFKYLISLSSAYDLVRNNILIEERRIRIGELDFILKELKTNQYIHVELAYKFYIIDPGISEPIYRLIGPNRRDMFYTKLDKLREKQLPLLHHNSLLPYWETHNINPTEIQQQCCFKAQLFEPFEENTSIRPLNGGCISGGWIAFDDFNSAGFSTAEYHIPRKQEWVIAPHPNVNWMGHFETLMEVNLKMVKENAPMLWVKRPSGEIEKLFVVWW